MSRTEKSTHELVTKIRSAVKNKRISAETLLPIVVHTIEIAEQFILSGEQKRAIVLDALETVVDETVSDPSVAAFIKLALPMTINTAVALTKGEYEINVPKPSCFCFRKKK